MGLDLGTASVADHVAQAAAEMFIRREAVDRRQCLVDPHEVEIGVHEGESHRRGAEDRVDDGERVLRLTAGGLHFAEEERVVDSDRGSTREVLREREVVLVVAASASRGHEGDRAEDAVPCNERHAHR